MSTNTTLAFILAGILAYLYRTGYGTGSKIGRKPRPPGPPQSIFKISLGWKLAKSDDVPTFRKFAALHNVYGPIVSFFQGRTPVVGTIKVAMDLLEKKGSIYSSRPRNVMAGELLSGNMRGVGMPYGQRWRNYRSLMHAGMNVEASNGYKALQSLESKILLRDLWLEQDSSKHRRHLRRFAISIVCFVSYGMRVATLDDPLVVAQETTDECLIRMSVPGQYIVESLPILLKLPKFMQWFRYEPLAQRAKDTKLYTALLESVRARMSHSDAGKSIGARALAKQANFGLTDVETAYALSAPFAAGVGSTLAVLDVFFLAMLHYPEVMKKAQAQIDTVVGDGRFPEFEDAEKLPYLKAVIQETMRWKPIAPLGVPHSVIADDVYDEKYSIPNGSTVIANLYTMSKDEEEFPCADEFIPERYLDSERRGSSPNTSFVFGFGRRVCPGMHIAQNSLFIIISRILWAYNILPEKDGNGKLMPLPDVEDLVGGLVVRPRNFLYRLEDRRNGTSVTGTMILEEAAKAESEISRLVSA